MGGGVGVLVVARVGVEVGDGMDANAGGGTGVLGVARVGAAVGDEMDVGVGGEVELEQATTATTATAAATAPSLTVATFEIVNSMTPERLAS